MRSSVLLGAVTGSVVACGAVLGGRPGILFGTGLGLMAVGGAWWFSDRIVIRFSGAQLLGEPAASELNAMLGEMADRAAICVPRLYVVTCPQPNSFAVGRTPRRAAIVVTDGLLSLLEPTEIRAVLAQELTHITRRDTQVTSVAGAAASIIFSVVVQARSFAGRRNAETPDGARVAGASITPVAAGLLHFALSSSQQSAADRGGSVLSGDPEALARALTQIERYARVVPMETNLACASPWLVCPFGESVDARWMFSTHPAVAERVARLGVTSSQQVAA